MINVNRNIISGARILVNQHWVENSALIIDEGIIKAIIPTSMIKHHLPAKQYNYPANYVLVPGFIDLHIHGADGKDVMDDSELAFKTIAHALAEEGVTGYLATTMTAAEDKIASVLTKAAHVMQDNEGAALLGVHLEGPFIAAEKVGAQRLKYARSPNSALVQQWQKLSKGIIKLITLAPELPEALSLIETLVQMGIVVSVGHSNATYEETQAAIEAGCTHATHLFNAMRGIHQREPGTVTALLLSDRVMTEVIVDGVHLHPAIVKLTLELKHKEHMLLITDAIRAKCLGDGHYDLAGQQVEVANGRVSLADGRLAGSILRMPQAIKNMMQFTHCELSEAILMASYNPACVLKLQEHKGSIEVGKDADLVVMDADLDVVLTMRGGREVFNKGRE